MFSFSFMITEYGRHSSALDVKYKNAVEVKAKLIIKYLNSRFHML